jgi:hypothetical protein
VAKTAAIAGGFPAVKLVVFGKARELNILFTSFIFST